MPKFNYEIDRRSLSYQSYFVLFQLFKLFYFFYILEFEMRLTGALRSVSRSPPALRDLWSTSGVPVASLKHIIDHDNHEMRDRFREFLKQPEFKPKYAITLDEEREIALERLQKVCSNDFLSVRDFGTNPHRIFAAHELMAMIDPATTTKMTVQLRVFTVFYDLG